MNTVKNEVTLTINYICNGNVLADYIWWYTFEISTWIM